MKLKVLKTRTQLLLIFIEAMIFIVLFPLLYILFDNIILLQLRESLIERLDKKMNELE